MKVTIEETAREFILKRGGAVTVRLETIGTAGGPAIEAVVYTSVPADKENYEEMETPEGIRVYVKRGDPVDEAGLRLERKRVGYNLRLVARGIGMW
ncbi:CC/Se motif family (seleno)protein [Neomoorella thermoacetica]|uniref:ABC-type Co2+ transport system, periplasmic component n=1 Tax=Moorella thermoacetica Y72 TaxID=1325331 RepID=A0A0S6UGV6_NEOTH|nr:CC/Se motif family (seleno)protein [Moorella thermoacetica]APC08676.1 hypothetical protein MTJW_15170 [Moorella thermoacetica]OIQ11390.1 hypothetical protein MOOTH_15920 [Moorella thermoacetica]GAF27240.1 ABC-type Co2+ transport system, periplasmic component [Moorella thermoacetica Y72]